MERDQARRDRVDTVKNDTRDAFDEAKERVKAGGERVKRAVEGDQMPLGERVASHAKEAAHDMKADFDKTKREVRDDATREEGV
ncbi:MAG TPA: hypothetical protein VMA36_16610 [Candidatus Limnocylindria bacterium]|nr:hypothetical protein [Candidatus Limnocylindria bacterium]